MVNSNAIITNLTVNSKWPFKWVNKDQFFSVCRLTNLTCNCTWGSWFFFLGIILFNSFYFTSFNFKVMLNFGRTLGWITTWQILPYCHFHWHFYLSFKGEVHSPKYIFFSYWLVMPWRLEFDNTFLYLLHSWDKTCIRKNVPPLVRDGDINGGKFTKNTKGIPLNSSLQGKAATINRLIA